MSLLAGMNGERAFGKFLDPVRIALPEDVTPRMRSI
jgi:hypothetical protein